MAVRINPTAQVSGLQLQLETTMCRIDEALDRGDRRAFRVWSQRWVSLSARCTALLVTILTEV